MPLPKKRNPLPKKRRPQTVEQQFTGGETIDGAAVVYQLERVRCGKASCKSCRGRRAAGHGPYWYAYWRARGNTRSIYIGKKLRSVRQAMDERARRKP